MRECDDAVGGRRVGALILNGAWAAATAARQRRSTVQQQLCPERADRSWHRCARITDTGSSAIAGQQLTLLTQPKRCRVCATTATRLLLENVCWCHNVAILAHGGERLLVCVMTFSPRAPASHVRVPRLRCACQAKRGECRRLTARMLADVEWIFLWNRYGLWNKAVDGLGHGVATLAPLNGELGDADRGWSAQGFCWSRQQGPLQTTNNNRNFPQGIR